MSDVDSTDIVAELDRWLAAWRPTAGPSDVVVRARDEIVALRQKPSPKVSDMAWTFVQQVEALGKELRAEALEEAAVLVDNLRGEDPVDLRSIVSRIRGLKDRGNG